MLRQCRHGSKSMMTLQEPKALDMQALPLLRGHPASLPKLPVAPNAEKMWPRNPSFSLRALIHAQLPLPVAPGAVGVAVGVAAGVGVATGAGVAARAEVAGRGSTSLTYSSHSLIRRQALMIRSP